LHVFTEPSLAELTESALLGQLMADPTWWRGRVMNIVGFPDYAQYFREVPCTGLPGELVGDIDVLVVPDAAPEQSIAIQAKRIKVGPGAFATGEPNLIGKLPKLRQQANLLAKVGFSQTYCYVFVVVDSRENNNGEFKYDGLDARLRARLDSLDLLSGLDENIGVIRFDLVQPINDRPLGAGSFAGRPVRIAKPQVQPQEITQWVLETKRRLASAA
jgi:hypothetical protein